MERTTNLNPLREIQTTKDNRRSEDYKEGEDYDQEQPLSPLARLFHEPVTNIYILAIFGMKTLVNLEVFRAGLVHISQKHRRFSSLKVDKENGSMTWVPTHLNLDNHVIVPEIDVNMESSDKFVEDYISNLSRSHIDNSKPLWDVHILNTKTSNAQSTCVFRLHHSLGDGISLMNLMLAYSRKVSDPDTLPTLPGDKGSSRRVRVTSFRSLFLVLWNSIIGVVMMMLTALFLKDTDTPLKRSPFDENMSRRFMLRSVSLVDIKMVKKSINVTVNDVIIGVIQAGLYRYLNRRYGGGELNNKVPKNIRLRANVTYNLRDSTKVDVSDHSIKHEKWGNKFNFVLLPFNIRPQKDPLDYVRAAKAMMDRKKASLERFITWFLPHLVMKLFGLKAALKLLTSIESRTTLWFSNMPGPQEEILFCGHEATYLASSCYGQPTALFINVVSYVDKVTFAVSVDEKIIPDPQILCDDLQQAFHLIKTSVSPAECV